MSSAIIGSVGRGGANRDGDVRLVQELLNRHGAAPPLRVDGAAGPKTVAAIEDAQRRLVRMAHPDGRVDPAGQTLHALQGASAHRPANGPPPPPPGQPLPAGGGAGRLTDADFARAAATLRCDVPAVMAVTDVESGRSGFFPSGKPKILFEAHHFSRLTQHRYDGNHPDISSRHWNRALYIGGEREYDRLNKALALDHAAALQSASWGRFQIMGFNYAAAGHSSVDTFVQAMYRSEGAHLDAFVAFVRHSHLDAALREHRWADFARGYNGAGYAANHYDTKLAAAWRQHGGR